MKQLDIYLNKVKKNDKIEQTGINSEIFLGDCKDSGPCLLKSMKSDNSKENTKVFLGDCKEWSI